MVVLNNQVNENDNEVSDFIAALTDLAFRLQIYGL